MYKGIPATIADSIIFPMGSYPCTHVIRNYTPLYFVLCGTVAANTALVLFCFCYRN